MNPEALTMSHDAQRIARRVRIATLIATLFIAGWTTTTRGADPEDSARVRRAVAYLDARQETWSQFAQAARGKGADKTTCVSCHTGISYVLARAELARFVAEPNQPPAQERITAQVGSRVGHWNELDSPQFRLMYDHDERKKVESRGTEAVLSTLILARADAERGRATPSESLRNALDHLWATQLTEGQSAGSWEWLNFGLEPWEAENSRAFGAALAAIAAGSAPGYLNRPLVEPAARGITRLRDYLHRRFPKESLYNRLWILEASTRFDGLISSDQRQATVEELLALQRPDGGWALATLGGYKRVDGTEQSEESDGYATGLALHLLTRTGLVADQEVRAKALGWLRSHQQADGSWPGRSVNKERDPATFAGKLMTDAATAIAALSLVESGSKAETKLQPSR
jgi:hypothetical protein